MDEEIIEILEEAGLTRTETRVYLALLKYGKATAYRISKEEKIYKANTYLAIESLVKKNLVIFMEENNRHFYKAVNPEEILSNLEREKEKIQKILPYIARNFNEEAEEVSVFNGINSFFNILYSLLDKKQPIYTFDIPNYVPELVKFHIDKFHKERIRKKIAMYHIYDYDAGDRIKYLTKMKYTYAKQGLKNRLSVTSTLICGDVTLIINWKKGVKIVKIVDKDIAEAYKHQFDILWNYKG